MRTQRLLAVGALEMAGLTLVLGLQAAGLALAPAALVGALLAWVAPGYALLAALFPDGMRPLLRASLTVPCSFVLCTMAGAVLDRSPIGLRAPGFVAALGLATLALLVVAIVRQPAETAYVPAAALPRRLNIVLAWLDARLGAISPANLAAAAFGGLLLVGIGAWARNGLAEAIEPPAKAFTTLAVDQRHEIVVDNNEGVPASYRAELVAAGQVLQTWPAVQVAPGGEWRTALPDVPSDDGQPLEVRLFRGTASEPYRTLILSQSVGGS